MIKFIFFIVFASSGFLNAMVESNETILREAAKVGNTDAIKQLAALGVDANETGDPENYGMDAVMYATAQGHTKFLQTFLATFDINFREDKHERTAFSLAVANYRPEILKILLNYTVQKKQKYSESLSKAAIMAAEYGHSDCLELLLNHGAVVKNKYYCGLTAMQFAVKNGHTSCIELLKSRENA